MANVDYTRCLICEGFINQDITGEPFMIFKNKSICSSCYIGLIPEIYNKAGSGDGGIIHLIFKSCLMSDHNKKQRRSLKSNKELFNTLLHKYKFECVHCKTKDNLTIDHIKPVAKGGTSELSNLQILCKSCNSKKGTKYDG